MSRSLAPFIFAMSLSIATALAQAQDSYEARLEAGRQAAHKRYLHNAHVLEYRPPRAKVTTAPRVEYDGGSATTGAAGATLTVAAAKSQAAGHRRVVPVFHRVMGNYPDYAYGNYNFNYHYPVHPGQHVDGYWPFIVHPTYDARYRRSLPRATIRRTFERSHWVYDNGRYQYVPSTVRYERVYYVPHRLRWHYDSGHYSVQVRYQHP